MRFYEILTQVPFEMFCCARYDGCCSDALQKAVAARVAALPETVYCTLTPEVGDR